MLCASFIFVLFFHFLYTLCLKLIQCEPGWTKIIGGIVILMQWSEVVHFLLLDTFGFNF